MLSIARRRRSFRVRKLAAAALLVSLFSNTLFAAPDSIKSMFDGSFEIKEDIRYSLARNGVSFSVPSIDTILGMFSGTGGKRPTAERIVIQPANADGTLAVMQGERVTFGATGFIGDDPERV
jgi:hypothetical protein